MSVGSTLVRGAEIRFQEAAEKLRPFVGCFWVITADRDAVLQLIPDGSTTRTDISIVSPDARHRPVLRSHAR